jgi:hypothetical protein
MDPRWNTCVRNFKGLHDPPIILTTGPAFSTVTKRTSDLPHPTKTNSLSPAQAIQQPSATKTPPPETAPITSKLPAVATIGGSTITANSVSAFVIGTQTLTPGGNIIVLGIALSMASDGVTLIISGTSTQVLERPYTVIPQSLVSGGPPVAVPGTVIIVETDGGGVTEDTSMLLHGGTSKTAN